MSLLFLYTSFHACLPRCRSSCLDYKFLLFAGLWGYVQYPVIGLASGLAPFSAISNSSEPLNKCIEVGSGGGADPAYVGRNVSVSM